MEWREKLIWVGLGLAFLLGLTSSMAPFPGRSLRYYGDCLGRKKQGKRATMFSSRFRSSATAYLFAVGTNRKACRSSSSRVQAPSMQDFAFQTSQRIVANR
jgi:hypothetical protein